MKNLKTIEKIGLYIFVIMLCTLGTIVHLNNVVEQEREDMLSVEVIETDPNQSSDLVYSESTITL